MKTAILVIAMIAAVGGGFAVWRGQQPEIANSRYRQLLSWDNHLMAREADCSSYFCKARNAWLGWRLDRAYKRFLESNPEHAPAMIAYGAFLYDRHQEDEAVDLWERAIGVDENSAHAYNNLANHYGHNGRVADALRHYQKAFELDPAEPVFRFNWATMCVLYREDVRTLYGWDTDEIFRRGLEQFRVARDLAPQDYSLAHAYAETFWMASKTDWREAHSAWLYCLDLPMEDLERQRVYGQLARVCIRLGRHHEAGNWLRKISSEQLALLKQQLERKVAELKANAPAS